MRWCKNIDLQSRGLLQLWRFLDGGCSAVTFMFLPLKLKPRVFLGRWSTEEAFFIFHETMYDTVVNGLAVTVEKQGVIYRWEMSPLTWRRHFFGIETYLRGLLWSESKPHFVSWPCAPVSLSAGSRVPFSTSLSQDRRRETQIEKIPSKAFGYLPSWAGFLLHVSGERVNSEIHSDSGCETRL